MIKILVIISLLTSFYCHSEEVKGENDYLYNLRVFKDFDSYLLMLEHQKLDRAYHSNAEHFVLSIRRNIFTNLSLGLLAKYREGARYNFDWKEDQEGNFGWGETKNRSESLVGFELRKKHWLFQGPFALEYRSRFFHHFINNNESLELRLGLLKFFDRFTLNLYHEQKLNLNGSLEKTNEFWTTFSVIYKIEEWVNIGHSLSYGGYNWSREKNLGPLDEISFYSKRFALSLNFYLF